MAPTSRADGKRFSPRFRSSRSTHPVKRRTACRRHLLRIPSASFLDSTSLQDCCSCAVPAFPQAWEETSTPDTLPPTAPAGLSLTNAFRSFTIRAGFPLVKARRAPLVVRALIAGAPMKTYVWRSAQHQSCPCVFGHLPIAGGIVNAECGQFHWVFEFRTYKLRLPEQVETISQKRANECVVHHLSPTEILAS